MPKLMAIFLTLALCLSLAPLALAEGAGGDPDPNAPKVCPEGTAPDVCNTDGRWGWYRMFVSANGMGHIKCGACNTAAGCTAFNTNLGCSAQCTAYPAPGNSFSHWTANGQYGGTDISRRFGKVGLQIVGNFKSN